MKLKIIIEKGHKKYLSQLGLTRQTRDPSHGMGITS
jgi:hypothetical protein